MVIQSVFNDRFQAHGIPWLADEFVYPRCVDRINQGFVLGNKVLVGSVNASRADYMAGVSDLAQAELAHPSWLNKLLTHEVKGLENYRALMDTLVSGKDTIKVYCEVSELGAG